MLAALGQAVLVWRLDADEHGIEPYRIAVESMNNAVKHAQATRISLRLQTQDGIITLEVHDDGVGFDPQGEYPGHLGLRSMRERAAQIGAALEIESAPGLGTQVKVRVYLSRGT